MFNRSASTRACAVSRPRAKVMSNNIATSDTATMLRTSKVRTKASGRLAPSGRTTSEITTVSKTTATNAANHGQARGGLSKATAPSGARSDHKITKLESSRPPSMIIPSAGATRIRRNCAVRRNAKFRFPGEDGEADDRSGDISPRRERDRLLAHDPIQAAPEKPNWQDEERDPDEQPFAEAKLRRVGGVRPDR